MMTMLSGMYLIKFWEFLGTVPFAKLGCSIILGTEEWGLN
jgi:hypothetical protein